MSSQSDWQLQARRKSFLGSAVVLISIMAVGLGSQAHAQTPKERPLNNLIQTEVVYSQEKGEVQFTVGSTFGRGNQLRRFETPLSMEYGIRDHWQLSLELDAHMRRTPDAAPGTGGLGDLHLGTKRSFMNVRGSEVHLAVGFEAGIPVGNVNRELSEGFLEYEPQVFVARDFPRLGNMQLFSQVGLAFVQRVKAHADPDEDEPAAHELNWNTGFFIPVRQARITGEFNWSTNRWNHGGTENPMYVTPGVVWKVSRAWEFAIGMPVGVNAGAERYRVVGKLTYEFRVSGAGE